MGAGKKAKGGQQVKGNVGGFTEIIDVSPTIQASAYADGDLIGGKQTLDAVFLEAEGTGILQSITLVSEDTLAADDISIIIFDSDPSNTTFTENGAIAVDDDDLPKILAVVSLDEVFTVETNSSVAQARNIGIPVKAADTDSFKLYAAAVARAAHTPSAVDAWTIRYGFFQD